MHLLRSGRIFKAVSDPNINSSNNSSSPLLNNSLTPSLINSSNNSLNNSSLTFDTADENTVNIETMADVLNVGLALKIVPEFSGESSRDLDRFISCCEIIVEPLSAPELVKFLNLLNAKLTGKAHDVLRFNKFETFVELKNELLSQFGESKSVESLTYELVSVRQDKNEDVRSFANKVEKILSMLDSACIKREGTEAVKTIRSLNAGTALKSFEEGLRDPIKLVIKASRFKSLKEAITGAIEEEVTVTQRRTFSQQSQPSNQVHQTTKCHNCHKLGHLASNCFQRQSYTPKPNNFKPHTINPNVNNPNFNVKQINKFCNYCKNQGHVIDECRKRIHNNSRKQNSQNLQNSQGANTKILISENSQPLEVMKDMNATLRVKDL